MIFERSQFQEPVVRSSLSHFLTGPLKPEPVLVIVHSAVRLVPSSCWPMSYSMPMSALPSPVKSPATTLERSQFHEPVVRSSLSHFLTGALKPEPVLVNVHRAVRLVPSVCWPLL